MDRMKTFEDKLDLTLREFASGMQRPTESEDVWKPLEKVVPAKQRSGFMFMGKYTYQVIHHPTVSIETYDYKHGISRKYLHIDKKGNCYCNVQGSAQITLKPCSKTEALSIVYEGIERSGATRETAYDEQYKYERNKALSEAGFTVMGISPGKITKKKKEYEFEEEM